MIDFKGKVALITGGSRGLGAAIALKLAAHGAEIAVNYRAEATAAQEVCAKASKNGVGAMAVKCDVAVKSDVDSMIDAVINKFGRLDILVNNAGVWEYNPIDSTTVEHIRRTIEINLMGCFYTCMAAVPQMKKQKSGSIIFISSTAGQRGEAFYSPYAATKSALIGMTKSLAPELVGYNIRVNCVAPGWFETDMSRETLENPDEAAKVYAAIPMGRVGRPEELAAPVVFIASDEASFITGEIFNVNGGAVLCG